MKPGSTRTTIRVLIIAIGLLAFPHFANGATIEYLGNEAVLVTDGETSILIDAFFDNDFGRYRMVPEAMATKLTAAEERFGTVDYVLVTHAHSDHFQADQIAEFMRANDHCVFVSSTQVAAHLRGSEAWEPGLESRVQAVELARGETVRRLGGADARISATWVKHGGEQYLDLVNLAFRIELPTATLLHTGDADATTARKFLSGEETDLAMVAFWQFILPEGEGTLDSSGIDRFVAIHIPTDTASFDEAFAAMPRLERLTKAGETIEVGR